MLFQLLASNFDECSALRQCVHQQPNIFLIDYVRIAPASATIRLRTVCPYVRQSSGVRQFLDALLLDVDGWTCPMPTENLENLSAATAGELTTSGQPESYSGLQFIGSDLVSTDSLWGTHVQRRNATIRGPRHFLRSRPNPSDFKKNYHLK